MRKDMELGPATAVSSAEPSVEVTDAGTTSKESPCKHFIGMALCLCACIAFSLSILIAKILQSYHYHTFTISLWAYFGVVPFTIPFIIHQRQAIKETIWPWEDLKRRKTLIFVILRGILGTIAATFQVYALKYMDIGDATVITFSTPVFVALVSWLFLSEKFSVVTLIAVLMTFGGILIITRPPFLTGGTAYDSNLLIGTTMALTAMVFMACVFIIIRYIRHVHYAFITAAFGVIGSLVMVPCCLATSTLELPRTNWDWFQACSMGALGFTAQTLLNLGARYEKPTIISLIRTCDVVFAFIWQALFLAILPDWFSFIGSGIVMCGLLLVGINKIVGQQREKSEV